MRRKITLNFALWSNSGMNSMCLCFVWDFKLDFQWGEILIFFYWTFLISHEKNYLRSTGEVRDILRSIYTSEKGWRILEYVYLVTTMNLSHVRYDDIMLYVHIVESYVVSVLKKLSRMLWVYLFQCIQVQVHTIWITY